MRTIGAGAKKPDKTEENASLKAQIDELKVENEKLTEENEKLTEENEKLTEENERLKAQKGGTSKAASKQEG